MVRGGLFTRAKHRKERPLETKGEVTASPWYMLGNIFSYAAGVTSFLLTGAIGSLPPGPGQFDSFRLLWKLTRSRPSTAAPGGCIVLG